MSDFGMTNDIIQSVSMNTRFRDYRKDTTPEMKLWTVSDETTTLQSDQIEAWIQRHEAERLPIFRRVWDYYRGRNRIVGRISNAGADAPSNNTPVPYGRKIVKTFTGYAYRPGFTTYKTDDENEPFLEELRDVYRKNNEHIKTSCAGRNMAIYGAAFEIAYIEADPDKAASSPDGTLSPQATPRFATIDTKQIIPLYNTDIEPKMKLCIRYYPNGKDRWTVELYDSSTVTVYDRMKREGEHKVTYSMVGTYNHFFRRVPVVAYYMGDDRLGVIRPVIDLIDDYDVLLSDSVVEFDRFANAYLRFVGAAANIGPGQAKPNGLQRLLRSIRELRVFQNLRSPDDVTFLTKDIPKDFVEFMTELIRNEIHKQSHVPDFMSERFGQDVSGVAVARLMFDFENLVADAEADFDEGLRQRIQLMADIIEVTSSVTIEPYDVQISHKRNIPLNVKEAAETARALRDAGFSAQFIAETMPDDLLSDVETELERQHEEREAMFDNNPLFGAQPASDDEATD